MFAFRTKRFDLSIQPNTKMQEDYSLEKNEAMSKLKNILP